MKGASSENPETRQVLHGIQLVLGEIRDLRAEAAADRTEDRKRAEEDRKRAEEDRKRAEEDRKRAEEDRKRAEDDRKRADERFEASLRESQRHFDRVVRESTKREKDLSRALVVIGRVGRQLVKEVGSMRQEHGALLREILRVLRARGNGRSGNGQN